MNLSPSINRFQQFALAIACGLGFLPGCVTGAGRTHVADHVYSTGTPRELDEEVDGQPVPVRARYPESAATDGTVHLSDVASGFDSASTSSRGPFVVRPPLGVAGADHAPQHSGIMQASYPVEAPDEFTFASVGGMPAAEAAAMSPQFTPAEARQPSAQHPSNAMETVAASPLADMYPDEYIFDGGDRRFPVHYQAGDRMGFESEDTIAEFTDHTGASRVRPSNRVAVYAPRFGSVRVVTGAEADVKIDQASLSKDSMSVENVSVQAAAEGHVLNTGLVGFEARQRVDGVDRSLPSSESTASMRPEQSEKADKGHEGRSASIPDTFGQTLVPELANEMQNAAIWSRSDFPILAGSTKGVSENVARFKVQQTVGVEDQRKTKGDVRIVKLADRDTAQAGDTIVFTIQFQNTGDFDVYDVSIVDNLTPRLLYVDGSATTDPEHPGDVSVAPNGEGSVVLTFKLDGPLKGHASGTITFEATVR